MSSFAGVIGRSPDWLPTMLGAQCILWCRADLNIGVASNGGVTVWGDMSGRGNSLAGANIGGSTNPLFQPTDSPQPSHQLLCNSADTSAGFFNVANPAGWNTGTGPIHMWAVLQMPASWPATHTIHGPIFDKNSTGCWTGPVAADGVGLAINVISNQGTLSYTYPGLVQANNDPTHVMNNGQTYLVEYFWDGGVLTLWINGTQTFSAAAGAAYTSATNANTLYIGLVGSLSNRTFPGKIFELGAFAPFSKADQARLQEYVRARYRAW